MNAELELQLRRAKVRLSRAAQRCMNPNDAGAPAEADEALREVASLQAQLNHGRNRCAEPGCDRITLRGGKCDRHRAPDIWTESRRVLDELQGEGGAK